MIKKCIFPVAGYGTRFLPVTKSIPKEMLPIGSRPLIEFSVEEAFNSNIRNLIFITSKKKQAINDYFLDDAEFEKIVQKLNKKDLLEKQKTFTHNCSFTYIYQEEMLGLGHAIKLAKDNIGDEKFAVILPDDLCFIERASVIEQLIEVSKIYPNKCVIAVEEVEEEETSSYGIISIKTKINSSLFEVKSIVEKPSHGSAPSNLAVIGRYILTPDIFQKISEVSFDKNGELQLTDALQMLAAENKVLALKFSGKRIDCGKVKGFIDANIEIRKSLTK